MTFVKCEKCEKEGLNIVADICQFHGPDGRYEIFKTSEPIHRFCDEHVRDARVYSPEKEDLEALQGHLDKMREGWHEPQVKLVESLLEKYEYVKDIGPTVTWNDPSVAPVVDLYGAKEFWVAIDVTRKSFKHDNGEQIVLGRETVVFCAQYLNRPIVLGDDNYPENDDYLRDDEGEPVSAVGWHSVRDHADYSDYFTSLDFGDDYVLLGWAEYQVPKFNGVSNER